MDRRLLDACELEALHLSGAILAHGTLLVIDRDNKISHVAMNVEAWLGAPPEAWLGQRLPDVLAEALLKLDRKTGSRVVVEGVMPALSSAFHGMLDLVASRNEEGSITLELLAAPFADVINDFDALCPPLLSTFSASPVLASSIAAAQQELVQCIMNITGFQRVMLYAFREDDDGEVIAEARRGEAYGSYLGLRFPASDIPHIARALYLKNPWRLIPDAATEPVPLLGRDTSPPDLTYSDLRSVSRIHQVYLANMGVRASLSFPVVVGGTLNALVACHNNTPRQVQLGSLLRAAQLMRDFGLAMSAFQSHQRIRLVDGLAHRFDNARLLLQRHGDLISAWPELGALLMDEFKADGATLCMDDACFSLGKSFEADALAAFDHWFCFGQNEFIWFGDSLTRQMPGYPLSEIAGAVALRVKPSKDLELRIYLTRIENIQEIAWGGNPEKPVESHDGTFGIAPRNSFEKWVEKRIGYSRPWDHEARLLVFKLRELLMREIR